MTVPSASRAASHSPPGSTLTSLRKLYDLLGDGITCRADDPVRTLEGHKGPRPHRKRRVRVGAAGQP